jgi:hypothetical protein
MQLFINQLVDAIKADYKRWMPPTFMDGTANANRQTMIDEFCARVRVTEGKKYYKVIQGTSVWGFIVKEDSGKFRKGDILKAAGWNAPATNSARGNIIDGGYSIQWTGPMYLR